METKRDLTKELLADCFKQLMLTVPFDKITIKMITNKAGLIRPTFYKHFQDKYEVLEWIFEMEIAANVDMMLSNKMEKDALVMLIKCLGNDKKFYSKAYEMDAGPNSFETILTRYIYGRFADFARRFCLRSVKNHPILTEDIIAAYYTYSLVNMLRNWLCGKMTLTAQELADAYIYLFSQPIFALPDSFTQ